MLGLVRPSGLSPDKYKIFRGYYCGLCWQLRNEYGHLARLLTNYENVLLALLIDAQQGTAYEQTATRCPAHLKSPNPHLVPGRESLQFATRLTVLMFELKVRDDVQDGGKKGLLLKRYHKVFEDSRRWLDQKGFPVVELQRSFHQLRYLEKSAKEKVTNGMDPFLIIEELTGPTADGLATVFGFTLDYIIGSCISSIKRLAGDIQLLQQEDMIRDVLADGIPKTLLAHYRMAQEGHFDEPKWKRLLQYSRDLKERHAARNPASVS